MGLNAMALPRCLTLAIPDGYMYLTIDLERRSACKNDVDLILWDIRPNRQDNESLMCPGLPMYWNPPLHPRHIDGPVPKLLSMLYFIRTYVGIASMSMD